MEKEKKIFTRLKDLHGFKNALQTAKAFGFSEATGRNLNNETAGPTLTNMARALVAYAEAHSKTKRLKILKTLQSEPAQEDPVTKKRSPLFKKLHRDKKQ